MAALVLGVATTGNGDTAPLQPVAFVRLLFSLPPVFTFVFAVASPTSLPKLMAPVLATAMAGLALWSAFTVATSLYRPPGSEGWLEVGFMCLSVLCQVLYIASGGASPRRGTTRSPTS